MLKENVAHGGVIVLPGVHKNRFYGLMLIECSVKWRNLYEVRPGTGDEQGAKGRKFDRAGGDARVRRPPPMRSGELAGDRL